MYRLAEAGLERFRRYLREDERTGKWLIPVTLPLAWTTLDPEECEEIGWEGE